MEKEDEEEEGEETPRNVLHPIGRKDESEIMRSTKGFKKEDELDKNKVM